VSIVGIAVVVMSVGRRRVAEPGGVASERREVRVEHRVDPLARVLERDRRDLVEGDHHDRARAS
jgi:hypothetical protein